MANTEYRPPVSWATMWDHADPPLFDDLAPVPDQHSSAARMANRRKAKEQAAQEARDMRTLGNLAQAQREDEALEFAVDQVRRAARDPHRHRIGAGTRELAMKALARREGTVLTTAEQLTANYLNRS